MDEKKEEHDEQEPESTDEKEQEDSGRRMPSISELAMPSMPSMPLGGIRDPEVKDWLKKFERNRKRRRPGAPRQDFKTKDTGIEWQIIWAYLGIESDEKKVELAKWMATVRDKGELDLELKDDELKSDDPLCERRSIIGANWAV